MASTQSRRVQIPVVPLLYHGLLKLLDYYRVPVHGTGSSLTEIVPLPVPGSCYGGSSSCYGEGNLGVLYFLLCFPKWPTWATLWTLLPLGGTRALLYF
jgi:hypothetical protein